jgi:hypothetical protein
MTQTLLWQQQNQSVNYAELCNALFERELSLLANIKLATPQALQGRLKSLSYYINRTARLMIQADLPLVLDIQNAAWQAKQSGKIPLTGQETKNVNTWYLSINLSLGLIVPVLADGYIFLDCIDRIDNDKQRIRTNISGWFYLSHTEKQKQKQKYKKVQLLKPNKKVMLAACSGHHWQGGMKMRPIIPSLQGLLLSCSINWNNFKAPLSI